MAALISGFTLFTGHMIGFPMWEDFTAGVVLGSTLNGLATAALWERKKLK